MDLIPLLITILGSLIASTCGALIGFGGAVVVMFLRDRRQDQRERRERERNAVRPVIESIRQWAGEVSKVTFDAYFSAVTLFHILLEEFDEGSGSGTLSKRTQAHQKELDKSLKRSAKLAREPPRALSLSFDTSIANLLVELLQTNRDICVIAQRTTNEAIDHFKAGSEDLEHVITEAEKELNQSFRRWREITESLESRCRYHLVA